jgi:D-inositol-3-phosphate glycosyltransferase
VAKEELPRLVDELVAASTTHVLTQAFDALHAHYWISGAVGHVLKHSLDIPLVTTFHTLAHTKERVGVPDDDLFARAQIEGEVVRCSDRVVASTPDERAELVLAHDADPERVEIIPPGVDHSIFFPTPRRDARRRLRLPDGPLLLFVGRIQPLKGADLAVQCLAALVDPEVRLAVVGGPSGPHGDAELARLHALAEELGVGDRVLWVAPQPHADLADWYRAADVCVVPSRTESFGLVALEAAACGTPVVAAAVGGLRALVDDGRTGFLVPGRTAEEYAAPVARLLGDPELAHDIGVRAAECSSRYTWSITAARLRRLYADVGARELLRCT